jgi:predicted transcriptional regulator YheO
LIAEADRFVAKPVAMMTKEDKTRAVQFLNEKGAFLIKKAGDKVSRHYDISKYTLYNYMSAEE